MMNLSTRVSTRTFGNYHDIISISCAIHQHLLSNFSPFHSPVKEKEKQWRIKWPTTAQWINGNWINRSVVAHRYPALWEKSDAILPLLMGLMAGRQAGRQNSDGFQFLKNFLHVNLFGFCCVSYHCNIIIVLGSHSSQLLSTELNLIYVLSVKNSIAIFFMSLPTIELINNVWYYTNSKSQTFWVDS